MLALVESEPISKPEDFATFFENLGAKNGLTGVIQIKSIVGPKCRLVEQDSVTLEEL